MGWKFDASESVSMQIYHRLKRDILTGEYPPGSQFPTVRYLACEAAVNPNTMQKAMVMLEESGLVVGRGTVGRFVTDDEERLSRFRREMQEAHIRRWLEESRSMGITKEQWYYFLEEKEEER